MAISILDLAPELPVKGWIVLGEAADERRRVDSLELH